MLVIFSSENVKQDHKLELTYLCLLDHAYEAPLANIKMERQRQPEKPLIMGRSGTVTKLLIPYCGAHLVESYCKEWNISDTNWLRYLSSSYLIKIWLSVWCHHLANLHILKLWKSLERKEIFDNSKSIFLPIQTSCLCFKMAWIGKVPYRHSTTLS